MRIDLRRFNLALIGKSLMGARHLQLHRLGYQLSDGLGDVHRARVAAPLGKLPCPKK